DALREELGDLLLQIVLHSQIAVDEAEFRMADVIEAVNTKMIVRHPHVWGDVKVSGADEVVANWDTIKRQQRQEDPTPKSLLDGVPKALPALAQAQSYQDRAARVGFDWPHVEDVLAKLQEEIKEVHEARTEAERADELGDVL